ncbi:GDSL-type esterase/lipase family protein, partial [Morganella morganii]
MATIPTQNAVPSEAPRDLKFNSGKIDEFVTSLEHEYKDRFGRCHMTIEGMRWIFDQLMARFKVDINQAIIAAGYIPMDSFQQGAEITKRNEILRDETTGEYYRWDGDLPKTVPAGSTPESAGGVGMGAWVSVGDASLRTFLSTTSGAGAIGTESGATVQDHLNQLSVYLPGATSATYRYKNLKLLSEANKKLKSGEVLRIVCVGDSITAGYDQTSPDRVPADNGDWATHASIQYPSHMQSVLNGLTGAKVTVINRGHSGDTAKLSYNRWTDNPDANVAHIMLGLNDSDGVAGATFEEFSDYLELVIRRYIDWGCGVVLHTPSAKQFDNTNHPANFFGQHGISLAQVYGCPVFNAHEVNQHSLYTGVYSDSTHFNAAGYARLGDAVSAFIM